MLADVLPLLVEFFELFTFGTLTLVLSVSGVYIERFAFAAFQSGQSKLGAWAAFIGLVILGFAYLIATDKLAGSLASIGRELGVR